MRSITILPHQTLSDIAIQEYGDMTALFLIAQTNDISPTAILEPGTVLWLPDVVVNKEMQDYCKNNQVSPATAETAGSEIRLRIFSEQFTQEFM